MAASEIIFVVDESPERGFEARALSHSIYTQADTSDALKEMVRDAVHCHLEESKRPQIIRLHTPPSDQRPNSRPSTRPTNPPPLVSVAMSIRI
jgi:hypothetical protein